jgi:outer membrane protein assembly factor BamB
LPSDNASSFVVVRDRKAIQKIGVSPLPVPHLELQAEATFEVPVYNQVAATGETVYLIRRGRNNDEIVSLSYDSLEELRVQEVAGRVVWGPYRVGDLVLVYTSASRVYCFDGQQQLLWRSKQVEMSPVGAGIEEGDSFLLTGVGGILWRVNVNNGATVSESQLGKKVIGSPFVVAGEVWVPTEIGVVSGAAQ